MPTNREIPPTAALAAQPLRPRPRLAWALGGAMAVWVAILITLYLTTVYPNRNASHLVEHEPSDNSPAGLK